MYVAVVESNKCLAKKMKENIEKYLGYKCIKISIYINAEEFLKQLFRYGSKADTNGWIGGCNAI